MWSAVPKVGVFLPTALAAVLALACGPVDGAPAPAGGPPGYVPTPEAPEPPPEGRTPRRLRRLTSGEMQAVIADLLGRARARPRGRLPARSAGRGLRQRRRRARRLREQDRGDRHGRRAGGRPPDCGRRASTARPPALAGEEPAACARRLRPPRGYPGRGRPPAPRSSTGWPASTRLASQGEGEGHRGGLALVTQALLTSPYFLYRSELGAASSAGAASGAAAVLPHRLRDRLGHLLPAARVAPRRAAAGGGPGRRAGQPRGARARGPPPARPTAGPPAHGAASCAPGWASRTSP